MQSRYACRTVFALSCPPRRLCRKKVHLRGWYGAMNRTGSRYDYKVVTRFRHGHHGIQRNQSSGGQARNKVYSGKPSEN
jgi:hypothetical protein